MTRRSLPPALILVLVVPASALAQVAAPRLNLTIPRFDTAPPNPGRVASDDARRACPGCPVRRVWAPFLESLALNVMYNGINRARGHPSAILSLNSWRANLKHGFEWDNNDWLVNQIGHPYQGSNYFTAGRAHGLDFWEASAIAAFGSATWEYFAENNRASFNDLINTTVGGIALGEVFHRMAWAMRDPTGKSRSRREWIALAIDPMSGLERILSGDRTRMSEKPAGLAIPYAWRGAAGVIWQGPATRTSESTLSAFVDLDLHYGDARRGRSNTPFDAFALQFATGGGPITQTVLRGRLLARPFGKSDAWQFSILQTFDFMVNPAYAFGAQGFEAEVGVRRQFTTNVTGWLAGSGGASILAAADTPLAPPDGQPVPPPINGRIYDYGPGVRFGGVAQLAWKTGGIATLSYQAYQVNVVDGTRANHILQRLQADVRVPVGRGFAVGAAGEYFFRQAYFWQAGNRHDQSPQARMFLAYSPTTAPSVQGPAVAPGASLPGLRTSKLAWLESRLWLVAGTGFSAARAGCEACSREGVFTNSRGFLVDAGVRVNPRVDAGVELQWVSFKVAQGAQEKIRTTFILGVAVLRPWERIGWFLRVGMGIGIAGTGLYSPIGPPLAPPFTTNALALAYGTGWMFPLNRRWSAQAYATHYVAALGELTTTDGSRIQNVVGNYWTTGAAIVMRWGTVR